MGSTPETQMTPTQVSDEEANLFAMQLATGSILHMLLQAAIELDLLEIMAKAGPGAFVSPADLSSQLPTKNPDAPVMLDRMLRVLASYSILTYSLRTLPDGKVERLGSSISPIAPTPISPIAPTPISPNHSMKRASSGDYSIRWGKDEVNLSLSLFSIQFYEKMNYTRWVFP
ncbi:hypothetical protein C1H46_019764 [Malus baccata]|uniref:O-methyltransferase dimerisation domain-containing protein n=1 Tax=Malus baccata TaxID=106549 RepID=A0A540M7Q2_MALBA|nr:hypothetical protein C1H46_019764 [Malus baccata]